MASTSSENGSQLQRRNAPSRRGARGLPGSYAWKALRNEVEHRAAAGEPLGTIMLDICSRHAHDVADVPSERTFRRWYRDARWEDDDYRTPLRRGFARRDVARARRAQEPWAAITAMREAHARRLAERFGTTTTSRAPTPVVPGTAETSASGAGAAHRGREGRPSRPARAP